MTESQREIKKLAVIGAGNMGSGIAQKMATEGFEVVLVDIDDEKVQRGLTIIQDTLTEGVKRKIFKPDQAEAIRERVKGTSNWDDLADVDLVVEAVFEDLGVKKDVIRRLESVCRADTILATNTSSFLVEDLARDATHPERIIGLHYFYHPAKNRLVEVIPGPATAPIHTSRSWSLQEQIGKTPIASADASGFVVNRYFVPWLNEAVRLLAEDVADIPTIEAACKKTFSVGMGPFELMNVTGVPIALHAATTLGEQFGPLYAPDDRLRAQVESGEHWKLEGDADEGRFEAVSSRMLGVTFCVAGALVDEGVSSIEDTDIGARVGLRWPRGPFQLMNRVGVVDAMKDVHALCERWNLKTPTVLTKQVESGKPFEFRLVKTDVDAGIATLTVNRPDAMNALNEAVVGQLTEAFRDVSHRDDIRGIVIAGAGKAFIAGADIRFFVRNMDAGDLERIATFTKAGHILLNSIDACEKTVVARLDGLALGGGLELALACDYLIASEKAMFAFPETGIGIYPGLGGTQRSTRRVGKGLAKWLIFSGAMVPARTAAEIGLVDQVVPHGQIDSTIKRVIHDAACLEDQKRPEPYESLRNFFESNSVDALRSGEVEVNDDKSLAKAAKSVGFKAPIALTISEKLIDDGLETTLQNGLQMELDQLETIFSTKDAYEGLSSLGRRRPEFKGH